MATPKQPASYKDLIRETRRPAADDVASENELDSLIAAHEERKQRASEAKAADAERASQPEPVVMLRMQMQEELIPAFEELQEKYGPNGLVLVLDVDDFLEGGRELAINISFQEHRTELHGTVTNEAIAFREIRYTSDIAGELASGPSLRLRQLTAKTFRDFVCERLTMLMRSALRRR